LVLEFNLATDTLNFGFKLVCGAQSTLTCRQGILKASRISSIDSNILVAFDLLEETDFLVSSVHIHIRNSLLQIAISDSI